MWPLSEKYYLNKMYLVGNIVTFLFIFVPFICHMFLSRIPLPELKDSDKLDKIMYMKESTKRIRLGPENLPSICFYSFLNAYQVVTCCVSDKFKVQGD